VTRPGIAAIASCTAVELVAALSQGGFSSKRTVQDESLLGSTPDQIRGFLGTFQSFSAVTEPFSNCICCSKAIVDAYRRDGIEFVKKVVMDSDVLMQTSGLSAFNTRAGEEDVIIFSEHEDGIGA
jgi:ubiquitin-like modifier-activating enzyme ATG7